MMTLMGKLFRPWDLAAENFGSESQKISSVSVAVTDSKSKRVKIAQEDGMKCFVEENKSVKLPERKSQSNNNNKEDLSKMCSAKKSAPAAIQAVSSCCDNSSYSHSPILQGGDSVKCYEPLPLSPADFDYHLTMSMNSCSGGNSSMFLYPNTINELASLSREELTVMGLLPPDPHASMSKVKRQRPKRFHCPHCQVAFSNNGQLRGHIRIHTGERPYKCEEEGCGKSFTRNEELTRHRRIHSGLRPFPCMYCGKKFGRKDHLKKHTRTHQRAMYSLSSSSLPLSPMPIAVGGMIGYGNPFPAFHPPLLSSANSGGPHDMNMVHSPYGLSYPSIPPSTSHFPLFS